MTPQTQITSKLFEGKTIRAIEYNGELWVPVTDVSEAWGLDRNTTTKIINRNPEIFTGLSTVINVTGDVTSPSDIIGNTLKCVNEQGVYVLALKVSAGRLKNKEVKKTIIRFQRWVPELIQKYRKGELILVPQSKQATLDCVNHYLDLADIAIKRSNVPKEVAHGQAWALAGTETGTEMVTAVAGYIKAQAPQQLMITEAIPQDKADYDMYFSLTKVAAALKLPIDKVRNVLESLNVIYFENGYWKLGKYGEKYGKVFMVMPGYPYRMNQKAYIKYNPEVFVLLRKHFDIEIPVTKVE